MEKVQHLYDYLIETELVTEEELSVSAYEGNTTSNPIFQQNQTIAMRDEYQINVLIENWPHKEKNIQELKLAILWWLSVYQGDEFGEQLKWEANINNSSTTDIWIGLMVDERTIKKDGKITTCIKQTVIHNPEIPRPKKQ